MYKILNLSLLLVTALLFSACATKYTQQEIKVEKPTYRKHSTLHYVVQDPNKNELMYLLQNAQDIKWG